MSTKKGSNKVLPPAIVVTSGSQTVANNVEEGNDETVNADRPSSQKPRFSQIVHFDACSNPNLFKIVNQDACLIDRTLNQKDNIDRRELAKRNRFRKPKVQQPTETCDEPGSCVRRKTINPFSVNKKEALSGGMKRKIVKKWGHMWESALSDLQFDRIVFENNPDAEQTYKSDKHRINDGCRKLWAIAKMNQNIITMMMKKFVSGPPNKLYSLNRIEAAQCWTRIVDDNGLVRDECCVDVPHKFKRKFNIESLKKPASLKQSLGVMRTPSTYKLPEVILSEMKDVKGKKKQESTCVVPAKGRKKLLRKNSAYWLDASLVPPVPPGFNEAEYVISAREDPTGEVQRQLNKDKIIAKRYTRFAHIIEKVTDVARRDPENVIDEEGMNKDPEMSKRSLVQNVASTQNQTQPTSQTMLTSPPSNHVKLEEEAKSFPFNLAEITKSKGKQVEIENAPSSSHEHKKSGADLSRQSTNISRKSTADISRKSTVGLSRKSTVEFSKKSTVEFSKKSTVEFSQKSTVEFSRKSTVTLGNRESTVDNVHKSTLDVSRTSTTADIRKTPTQSALSINE